MQQKNKIIKQNQNATNNKIIKQNQNATKNKIIKSKCNKQCINNKIKTSPLLFYV